jgi:hypothetical protein
MHKETQTAALRVIPTSIRMQLLEWQLEGCRQEFNNKTLANFNNSKMLM